MAGNTNIKYTFQVDANTAQAKKAMDELRRSMDKLSEAQAGKSFFNEDLNKAVASAKELKFHLNQAMDANTGQLNLNAFNKSLKDAGQSATHLMQNLLQGGAQGQQTFIALASAIAQSEAPLRRVNQTIKDFGTTLKNTVKWEISSSVVHGLASAFSGAVSYAKNLNTSLTDIRIVTGKSVEDMAKFAEQANKAAKALSTTTKSYTDASLIYYQQGDDEETVKKKTEITLKAANAATKTSAAEMSEYLTAVWNSYQVGADELERYVDIMAALGAKTATSLEEIATSMQKVAATGNTVGVSMEQVSSIIATVSSVTRESAESIGTSYKTIFARMGDLKLGAKDEDGIGLGQVSKSLESIGVEVLDASGDLREMGDIITDLGNKWQGMSNAEKTAIAQVVAGKRQYTQLMALFENWDMYQENMSIAGDSQGALQGMADIYTESWEAASARAKASMESIYAQLLNDQAIIKFTDNLTGITDAISGIIDSFGGLTGVLTKVGAVATAVFQKSMAKSIGNAASSLGMFFSQFQGKSFKEVAGMFKNNQIKSKEQIEYNRNNQMYRSSLDKMVPRNQSDALAINSAKTLLSLKEQLIGAESKLSDTQKARAQSMIGDLSKEQNKLIEMQQEYDKYEAEQRTKKRDLSSNLVAAAQSDLADIGQDLNSKKMRDELDFFFADSETGFGGSTNVYASQITDTKSAIEVLQTSMSDMAAFDVFEQNLTTIKNSSSSVDDNVEQVRAAVEALKDSLSSNIDAKVLDDAGADIEKLEQKVKKLKQATEEFAGEDGIWDNTAANMHSAYGQNTEQAFNQIKNNAYDQGVTRANMKFGLAGQKSVVADSESLIKKLFAGDKETVDSFGKSLSSVVGTAMSLSDAFYSGSTAVETLTDKTASLGSKMMSVASAASSLVSGFMSGGPWGLVLSAIGLIASAVIQGFKEAEEARKKLVEESISETTDMNNTNQAELSNAQSLLNTYNELYAQYEAGADVQDSLRESAMSLAEAYSITDAAIAAMSGDFKSFNEILEQNLQFTKQLEDSTTAISRARTAVNNAKVTAGHADVSSVGLTGLEIDQSEAFDEIQDSYYTNLLIQDANTGSTGSWNLLGDLIAQNGGSNETGDAADIVGLFMQYAIDNYGAQASEAFQKALTTYGLQNTNMDVNVDPTVLMSTLNEKLGADVNFGAFLQSFYSNIITEGGRSLVEQGINFSDIKTNWDFSHILSNGSWTAADFLEYLDLDNLQFTGTEVDQSVISAAQKFDISSLGGEDGRFSQLFDQQGNLTWDTGKGSPEEIVATFDKYLEWQQYLEEYRKQLSKDYGEDSNEVKLIDEYLSAIESTIGKDTEISKSVEAYKTAQGIYARWVFIEDSLAETIGKSAEHTGFAEYMDFHEKVIESIKSAAPGTYSELDGLDPETDIEAYNKAVSDLARKMISDSSAFDEYALMYSSLAENFNADQMALIANLADTKDLTLNEITADFIDALQIFFSTAGEELTKDTLLNDSLINAVIGSRKAALAFNENQSGYTKMKNAEGSLKRDMTMEEAESFYDNYWGNEKLQAFLSDRGKSLIAFTDFTGKSFEEQQDYLETVTKEYLAATESSATDIINKHSDTLTQLNNKLKLTGEKYGIDFSSTAVVDKAEEVYSNFLNGYVQKGDQWFQKGVENATGMSEEDAFSSYLATVDFKDYAALATLDLSGFKEFYQIQSEINQENTDHSAAQAFLEYFKLIGNESLTATEKIQTYADIVNNLSREYTDFAKTGKLSTEAVKQFTKMGIDPATIKSAQDYITALETAKANAQALLSEIQYDGYDPNTMPEFGSEEYNKWIKVKEIQLEVAGLADTIFNTTLAGGETQISAMEARVAKLKEDAEKYRENAEILENAIETGELSNVQKATLSAQGFDFTAWNNATTAIQRANVAAKEYSTYAAKIAAAHQEDSQFYADAANKMHSFDERTRKATFGDLSDIKNFDNLLSVMKEGGHLSDEFAAAWKKAYTTIAEQTNNFSGMNNTEIITKVRAELERLGKDAGNAGLIAAAAAKDNISKIFADMAQEHQNQAQAAADAWKTAFEQIAQARQKLIGGESLVSDIANDPETLMQYLQSYRLTSGNESATASDLYAAMKVGLNPESLSYSAYDINKDKAIYGLDLTNKVGVQFGTTGYYNDRYALMNATPKSADITFEEYSAGIRQQQAEMYAKILQSQDSTLAYEDAFSRANNIIDGKESYDAIKFAAADLISIFETAAQAAQDNVAYQEAQKTYEQTESTQQDIIDKTEEYQGVTDSILELSNSERTAGAIVDILSSAGISTDDYITSMQQKGLQVNNLQDVAGLSDQSLTSYKHSLSQDAIAAGETIKSAAVAFKAIVTGDGEGQLGYGEESAEGQIATTAVEEATDVHQTLMDASYAEAYNLQQNQFNASLTGASEQLSTLVSLESVTQGSAEWAQGIDDLSNAYAGLEDAQKIIKQLKDGTIDLNKANDDLTDITLKSADAVYDYNDAQWDQYKQTLRSNNVIIDGYKTLEEYLDEIEDGRKTVKKWTSESKKLNKVLEKQGKDLDTNKDGLLDYGEAAGEVQKAWEDLYRDGIIDEQVFKDGQKIMDTGVQNILNTAQQIVDANPEYDFSQGLQEAVTQYGADSTEALATLASMMGYNRDECIRLAQENSVQALQNLIVNAIASGSINWGNIPSLVARINAWLTANGIAGKRLVSPTGGSGGGGGGASGGGGSGGGGGGGGKQKQEKEHKRLIDEQERYHRNNSAIKQVENELKKLTAIKDSAYGKNYVAAIDAETAALKREREEQEKLRQEAENYVKTDAAALMAAGAQIGENGVIENYDALIAQWVAEYNAAVDAWNNSEQEESDEKAFEDAEQLYEDRLQMIENYEEALDTAAEAEARLQEILNEISENTLEGITYTLELELEVNERDLELLEYYREQYEETLEDQDNLFANLMQQASEYETNFASLQAAYNDLMAEYNNGNGDLQADEYAEGLADLHSQILENLENLQDIKEQIAEVYANALDLAAEEIENATDALDHMNETMEAYIAIMGLSGRETDYATMQAFYDAQFATNMSNIEVQMAHLAALREQEEYFREKIEQDGELTELEEEQYRALMEQIRETESAVLDSTQTTLEVLQAGYENTINRIAQDLDEFMAGAAGSISHLQEQYAYFQEEQGRYVSTAKELYEVSSLNREIENTLAETTSAASKEALKALQEKINKQSELNEMTEYDIEMNQLQYQLLLARIQLEEAQNSKDTVRLTRDDNGNYAYQYTADEDNVSKAMQKYEDTLQQMNDLTVKRTSEIEQQMINSMAEYKEKMQEIAMDTTLSESEKYNRLLELQSQFDAEMAYLQEQAGIANENLLANQEAIADHYGVNITAITSSTAGNVNQTVQDMIANAQQYSTAMHDALFGPDGVSQSWADYLAAVTTVQQASGTTVDDMLNNTANVGDVNEDAVQAALDAIEALTGTLEPINQMTEAWNAHQEALQGTIDTYEDLLAHINDLMAALGQTNTNANLDPEGANTGSSTRAGVSVNSDGTDKKKPQYGKDYFDEITANSFEEAIAESHMDVLAEQMNHLVDHYLEVHEEVAKNDELTEWEKYKQLEELQQNYEEEMEILRNNYKKQQGEYADILTNSGDVYEAWLDHIDTLTHINMLNNYHAPGLNNEAPVVIDQNVTIEAEFPNVSNTDEIIEAFNELINRAAQFASAKK